MITLNGVHLFVFCINPERKFPITESRWSFLLQIWKPKLNYGERRQDKESDIIMWIRDTNPPS